MNQDRTRINVRSLGTRTLASTPATTPRLADAAKPAAPSGQLPATVTEAFIHLVNLLDQRTTGPTRFDVVVRDRMTGRSSFLPVTEDMAVALLTAASDTASNVRPSMEHSRTPDTAPARALKALPGGVGR